MGTSGSAASKKQEFERLLPHELDRLSDEEVVDYVAAARAAGDPDAARDATGVLVWGVWVQIRGRVALKVPREDVEDVAGEVVASMMRSAFEGKLIGQFRSFLSTVTSRRIADYHEDRKRRLEADPLPDEHEEDEEIWGEGAASEGGEVTLPIRDAVERVLASLSEVHRLVVRLYGPNEAGFMGLSAEETVQQINADLPEAGMSEANVFQIWKRFKTKLEGELDG